MIYNQKLGRPTYKSWEQVYLEHMMSIAVVWDGKYPVGYCVMNVSKDV